VGALTHQREIDQLLRARVVDHARRITDLTEENRRLKLGLLQLALTINRSDPFFDLWMDDFGDLVPQLQRTRNPRGDAA
jgi:hypothetical protein